MSMVTVNNNLQLLQQQYPYLANLPRKPNGDLKLGGRILLIYAENRDKGIKGFFVGTIKVNMELINSAIKSISKKFSCGN